MRSPTFAPIRSSLRSSGILIGVTVLSGGIASLLSIPLNVWALTSSSGSAPSFFVPDVFLLCLSVISGAFPLWLALRRRATSSTATCSRYRPRRADEVEEGDQRKARSSNLLCLCCSARMITARSNPTLGDLRGMCAPADGASLPRASANCNAAASSVHIATVERTPEDVPVELQRETS